MTETKRLIYCWLMGWQESPCKKIGHYADTGREYCGVKGNEMSLDLTCDRVEYDATPIHQEK